VLRVPSVDFEERLSINFDEIGDISPAIEDFDFAAVVAAREIFCKCLDG
jgi:hypothetical protein